jgi:sec-independent protein translocase protein TatA
MNLAGPDLFIVLLIVLVLFGAKRLPELARGLGQAMNEFHKAKQDFSDELQRSATTEVRPKPAAAAVPRIENSTPENKTAPNSPNKSDAAV